MKVLSQDKPLEVFQEASNLLLNAVKHTLGPNGMNTAVCTSSEGVYQILNDGKAIVEKLTSDSPAVAPALELVKQSCFETNRVAGDGTTSTIIMTNKLLSGCVNYLNRRKDLSTTKLRGTLEDCRDKLISAVDTRVKKSISDKDYEAVATVALGGSKYAKLIADAYRFVGKTGTVSIIREDRPDTISQEIDGISLDKIKLPLTTKQEGKELFDIKCVCVYDQVDRFSELRHLLNHIARTGSKVILFYNEVSYDVLSNIFANNERGTTDVIPVRLGGYGTKTRDIMEQISEYTGCTMYDGIVGKLSDPDSVNTALGLLEYVFLSDSSIIIRSTPKEDYFSKINKLGFTLESKSCIIRVGGNNKIEQEETFRRIEDAISSLGSAINDGITVGGGLAYIYACDFILNEECCLPFIVDVMNSIYLQVIENMGFDRDAIGFNYLDDNWGKFPSDNGFVDLPEDVYDSSLVIKEVIRNSFSLVAQMITTERLIHEIVR